MVFATIDLPLNSLPLYPSCKVCDSLVVDDGFVAVAAVDEHSEQVEAVCGECCAGYDTLALDLVRASHFGE